jgi:PPOX class probable F420-dependent enzyme
VPHRPEEREVGVADGAQLHAGGTILTPVDLDRARDFVRVNHRAVLATRRSDGAPQLSPVTVAVDGDGRFVVSSRETAFKVRNLRRDPHASLCAFTDAFFGEWVQVDGTADVLGLPDAMDALVEYYRSVSGEHPDWDDYRAAMVRDRRVVVRITPERAGPDRAG